MTPFWGPLPLLSLGGMSSVSVSQFAFPFLDSFLPCLHCAACILLHAEHPGDVTAPAAGLCQVTGHFGRGLMAAFCGWYPRMPLGSRGTVPCPGPGVTVFQSHDTMVFEVSDGSLLYLEFKVDFQNTLRKELNFSPLWACVVRLLTCRSVGWTVSSSPSSGPALVPLSRLPPSLCQAICQYTRKTPPVLASDCICHPLSEERCLIFKMTVDLF